MKRVENIFNDVKYIPIEKYSDNRGYFSELYNKKYFYDIGIENSFHQDNISFSLKKYTLRGMHFQLKPFSQSKLIKVIKGSIFDVFIDLRKESDEFENFGSFELKEDDGWLLIPKGYAHGFLSTSEETVLFYKVDEYYNKNNDFGIIWNDPFFNVPWPCDKKKIILSEKDQSLSNWQNCKDKILEEV